MSVINMKLHSLFPHFNIFPRKTRGWLPDVDTCRGSLVRASKPTNLRRTSGIIMMRLPAEPNCSEGPALFQCPLSAGPMGLLGSLNGGQRTEWHHRAVVQLLKWRGLSTPGRPGSQERRDTLLTLGDEGEDIGPVGRDSTDKNTDVSRWDASVNKIWELCVVSGDVFILEEAVDHSFLEIRNGDIRVQI